MAWKTLRFKFTGDAPLIMHSGVSVDPLSKSAKALKAITSKKAKTDADYARMAEIEFKAGLYLDEDSGPIIPSFVIEAAIYSGAAKTKEGKVAKSALYADKNAVLQYEGPRDPDGLFNDDRFRFASNVRVGQSRVVRTRPRFPEWAAFVDVMYEDSVVNEDRVVRWVQNTGTQVGLCDWRPRYGRFTAQVVADAAPAAPKKVGVAASSV